MMLRNRKPFLLCPVSADAISDDEAASTLHIHLLVPPAEHDLGKDSSQQRAHISRATPDLDSVSSLAVATWDKTGEPLQGRLVPPGRHGIATL